jgi:catechol 2,3-dioxygenase-like lactoylglutathione lyase family enzyme
VRLRLRDGRRRGGAGAVIVGLDHVLLAAPADCEMQARAFYGELLGLAELPKPPTLAARGGVWFAVGSAQQLHIGVEAAFVAARKAHPALVLGSPAALEALAAKLEAQGHEVRWDADPPGVRRFHVNDPFGNRLELLAA